MKTSLVQALIAVLFLAGAPARASTLCDALGSADLVVAAEVGEVREIATTEGARVQLAELLVRETAFGEAPAGPLHVRSVLGLSHVPSYATGERVLIFLRGPALVSDQGAVYDNLAEPWGKLPLDSLEGKAALEALRRLGPIFRSGDTATLRSALADIAARSIPWLAAGAAFDLERRLAPRLERRPNLASALTRGEHEALLDRYRTEGAGELRRGLAQLFVAAGETAALEPMAASLGEPGMSRLAGDLGRVLAQLAMERDATADAAAAAILAHSKADPAEARCASMRAAESLLAWRGQDGSRASLGAAALAALEESCKFLLKDASEPVRVAALLGYGRLAPAGGLEVLRERLRVSEGREWHAAVVAIARLDRPEGFDFLRGLAEAHPEPESQRFVHRVLRRPFGWHDLD